MSHRTRALLYLNQRGLCCWCGQPLRLELSTIEHIIPRSRGGGSNMMNLALAHARCNNNRGSQILGMQPHPSPLFDFVRERLAEYREPEPGQPQAREPDFWKQQR